VGTLYPLVLDALTGARISVGAPFFNLTFGALMVPLLIVLPFGPFLAWKRGDFVAVTQRMTGAIMATVLATIVIFAVMGFSVSLVPLGFMLGIWVAFGAIAELADRIRLGKLPVGES